MLGGSPGTAPFSTLILCALVVACGGSTPAADAPSSGEGSSSDSDGEGASQSGSSDASDGEHEGSATAEPAKPRCDDGTCSPCGDALCPSGWYCDESAPGGPACGWLPEYAGKATCSCVKRAFSGCSCEDQAGSAHLRCG
jgi:hypothetical protein